MMKNYPNGLTIKELKSILEFLVESDPVFDEASEVWLDMGNGTSNVVKTVSSLNRSDIILGLEETGRIPPGSKRQRYCLISLQQNTIIDRSAWEAYGHIHAGRNERIGTFTTRRKALEYIDERYPGTPLVFHCSWERREIIIKALAGLFNNTDVQ